MRRYRAGHYATLDGRYRVERGWFEAPGTDRRRQGWVLLAIAADGTADILYEGATLAACRAELDRRQALTR